MAVKKLVFDIMLNDRFVCTMRMPITFDVVDDIDEMGGGNNQVGQIAAVHRREKTEFGR